MSDLLVHSGNAVGTDTRKEKCAKAVATCWIPRPILVKLSRIKPGSVGKRCRVVIGRACERAVAVYVEHIGEARSGYS
jgi:hypothetical protein